MKQPGLLIIEDDWTVASWLRVVLSAVGADVVGIASRADQVAALVREHRPALALVDIELGRGADGVEVARSLILDGVGVVFTSAHSDDATLARVKDLGASGFVVKPFSQSQIRAAVTLALGARAAPGARMASQVETARRALAELAEAIDGAAPTDEVAVRLRRDPRLRALSERERAVLLGLVAHRRVPAIAEHLSISAHTVRNHLKSVFAKFGVGSQQELLDAVLERADRTGRDMPVPPARPGSVASLPRMGSSNRPG